MRKVISALIGIAVLLLLVQCQPDKITITPVDTDLSGVPTDSTSADSTTATTDSIPSGVTVFVSSGISVDETWNSGNTYILNGLITVTNGATLTIEPCVVIKAVNGATALVIDQGARINATGTASCPIIFTSESDSIAPGQILSPNLAPNQHGLWGGIFILGEAPVSFPVSPAVLEAIPPSSPNVFGGTDPSSNSGKLNFVSIRHTGYELVDEYTPSGLILAGVGSNTIIDHVELYSTSDDGFVIMGGTADIRAVITSAFGDDAIDCALGYAGTIENLIGIGGTSANSSLELDGGEVLSNPSFTIKNSSFRGSQKGGHYIDFKNNVNCLIETSYFFGFDSTSHVILEGDLEANHWINASIEVTGLEINTSQLSTGNTSIPSIFIDRGMDSTDAFAIRPPSATIVTTPTVGADKTMFTGWTVADQLGLLNDF